MKKLKKAIISFIIPFVLVSVYTAIVSPSLWKDITFWGANLMLSIMTVIVVFHPLPKFEHSDVEQNPKEDTQS